MSHVKACKEMEKKLEPIRTHISCVWFLCQRVRLITLSNKQYWLLNNSGGLCPKLSLANKLLEEINSVVYNTIPFCQGNHFYTVK